MQTLLEHLRAEYVKHIATIPGATFDAEGCGDEIIDGFIRFSHEYLTKNRVQRVDHRMPQNVILTIGHAIDVVVSPLLPGQKADAGLRNMDVVGVNIAEGQAGGMDNVPTGHSSR